MRFTVAGKATGGTGCTETPSRRFRWSADVRVDRCDKPDSADGDILVKITWARTCGDTWARGPPQRFSRQTGKAPLSTTGLAAVHRQWRHPGESGDVLAPPPLTGPQHDLCAKRRFGGNIP